MPAKSKKTKTKKKATKKAVKKRRKPKKKAEVIAASEPTVDLIEQQTQIWNTYGKVRSIAMTAELLGVTVSMVRSVLAFDRTRLERIKQDAIELTAAKFEGLAGKAMGLLVKAVTNIEGDLLEIDLAVAQNRMTTIRNDDGMKLPVLNARQLMINAKVVDQLTNVLTKAQTIAGAIRLTHQMEIADGDADGTGLPEVPTFDQFSPLQLCQMIEDVDPDLVPESLKLKADRIKKQLKQC